MDGLTVAMLIDMGFRGLNDGCGGGDCDCIRRKGESEYINGAHDGTLKVPKSMSLFKEVKARFLDVLETNTKDSWYYP
jgi:hypothetical protein